MNEALIAFESLNTSGTESAADGSAFPTLPENRQSDADFFGRLMDGTELQPASASVPAITEPRFQSAIGGPNTLGSAFVNVADKVGADYKQNISRVYSELDSETLTTRDLLKIQMDLLVVSVEVDVVGKGVQKGVQHFDTLVNMK